MTEYLNRIRKPGPAIPFPERLLHTIGAAAFGLALGWIAKALDCTPSNELPFLVEYLDVRNFFGEMAIWILLAVIISVGSRTPLRAGLHVFLFFTGMLVSYYAYTKWIAGFFPKSYIMIWVGFTCLSPFLAAVCWYAKGQGTAAFLLSSAIVGILFKQAFAFGSGYFDLRSILNAAVWLAGVAFFYKSPRQLGAMMGCSVLAAVLWRYLSPFSLL